MADSQHHPKTAEFAAPMPMPSPNTQSDPMDQPPPYSVPELSEAVTKDAQALAPPPVQATPHNLTIRNRPIIATCPKCQTTVTSTIVPKVGTKAGIFALLTCLICWPLVWLPLCMDSCQDEVHQCPNCKTELGRIPA